MDGWFFTHHITFSRLLYGHLSLNYLSFCQAVYNRYAAQGHQLTYEDDDAVMPQPSLDHMARNQEDVHSSENHLIELTTKLCELNNIWLN